MPPCPPKPSTGPPHPLISRIDYLGQLLNHLPTTIPLDPPDSLYRFYLDEDRVTDAGSVFPETGRALEISFGTWQRKESPVTFMERGARLNSLAPFLKKAVKRMSPSERTVFETSWIDRLVKAAKDCGAVMPSRRRDRDDVPEDDDPDSHPPVKKKKRTAPIIIDSDSDVPDAESTNLHTPRQTLAPDVVIPSTSSVDLKANKQATLASMGWQAWAPGAKEAHLKEANKLHRTGMEMVIRRREEDEEKKEARQRELAAERQRRHREKKKLERDVDSELSDDNNMNVVLIRGADAMANNQSIDVAGASRAGTQGWRAGRNGTKGGAVQKKAVTVNWFNPNATTGWSPSATVRNLQRQSPVLFKGLAKGTISRWRVKGKSEWTPATLEKVVAGRAITASGRTGILAQYPNITKNVKETLRGLRDSGAVVNVSIARGLMLAEISAQQPQILDKFKVSEKYVRTFFASVMDWTPRKATRQARHIPADAPSLLKRTFFRLRYAILTGRIPPEVDVVAKDEKRAYTMMLTSTAAGDFLPIQAIWSGKTPGSLPKLSADKMQDAKTRGFIFSSAKSKKKGSHFATFSTMKEWVRDIVAPWREKIIASRDDLDDDQLMICYIDIYPVHTGEEFRGHVFKQYPYIILIFVPGGFTGLAQPADVGLQRVAKHILKQDSLDYLVGIFKTQASKGVVPKDVKFPSGLPVLRDATVRGLVKMYDFFQTQEGHKIVKQAWRKCEILGTQWNLSAECLTGRESEKALREFLREDSMLATEIANRCGASHLNQVLMAPAAGAVDPDPRTADSAALTEEEFGDFDTHDDSDVSFRSVVHDALDIVVTGEFSQHGPTATTVACTSESDGLAATDDSEDVWAYTDSGERWDQLGEVQVEDEPGILSLMYKVGVKTVTPTQIHFYAVAVNFFEQKKPIFDVTQYR
ncbi:hypothetical protein C8R44DRAFT_732842 [Mycena epipterygia]|nr:hypothetical protein C8R44DRAFT_732842 [Mycena epipterygia]